MLQPYKTSVHHHPTRWCMYSSLMPLVVVVFCGLVFAHCCATGARTFAARRCSTARVDVQEEDAAAEEERNRSGAWCQCVCAVSVCAVTVCVHVSLCVWCLHALCRCVCRCVCQLCDAVQRCARRRMHRTGVYVCMCVFMCMRSMGMCIIVCIMRVYDVCLCMYKDV